MKKVLIIFGVLLAMVVLAGAITPAFANDDVNLGKPVKAPCDDWLMGKIEKKCGTADDGNITLASQDDNAQVVISVDGDTMYKAWMKPAEDVTFASLEVGNWIAVCVKDDLAKLVILLKPPQIPSCIRLVGNVTSVSDDSVIVKTGDGSKFTISGIDTEEVVEGQPVRLAIGNCVPFLGQYFPGLKLGWLIGKGNQGVGPWIKNNDFQGRLEQFREKYMGQYQQRFERWGNRHGK